MTPGTLHHHINCDRVQGYLIETSCRELIGARGAARGHRQAYGPPPQTGLRLQLHTTRPALLRESRGRLVKFGLPDNDYGHAVLALHVLAALLSDQDPTKNELPLFVWAFQDWRKGFAPMQCWQVPYDPYLGVEFLSYLKTSYRYDLLTKPVAVSTTSTGTAAHDASIAQALRSAAGATDVSISTRTRSAAPIFGHEVSEQKDGQGSGLGADA